MVGVYALARASQTHLTTKQPHRNRMLWNRIVSGLNHRLESHLNSFQKPKTFTFWNTRSFVVKFSICVPNALSFYHGFSAIKSKRNAQLGQIRYRWKDLMEIHRYKLFKTNYIALSKCKTSKNLKNGHCPFKAAIADIIPLTLNRKGTVYLDK